MTVKELRAERLNNKNEKFSSCHRFDVSVSTAKNDGKLSGRDELYSLLRQGMEDVGAGNAMALSEAIAAARAGRRK
ncbi:MAG: hypothetical protein IJ164_03355 [Duodenibacillus sp.]|nr:hypothetical protein [Duodenibacillus sp.]